MNKFMTEAGRHGRLSKQWSTFMDHLNVKNNYHPESLGDLAAATCVAMHTITAMGVMCRGVTTEEQFHREFDVLFQKIGESLLGDPRCHAVMMEMIRQKSRDEVRHESS